MASGIYNIFKKSLFEGNVDLSEDSPSDVIKVALMNNDHTAETADLENDTDWTDVSANELVSGNGYTTWGETLAGKAVTQAATTKFDATDVAWTSATFTAYHAVIYNETTGELIASIDFGGAKTVAAGTFTIQWNASGIITMAEA